MDPRTLRTLSNADLKARVDEIDGSLKALVSDLTEYEVKASALRAEIGRQTQHVNTLKSEIDRRNRPAPVPKVSEHALLRYIERAHGIDLEALKDSILTPNVVSAIQNGASGITLNGVKFVVEGFTIVTVLNDAQRFKKADKKRGDVVDATVAIADGIAEYEADKAEGRAA